MFSLALAIQLSLAAAEQPPVISSASRWPETVDRALASVDVITRADIDRLQARDVIDVLRQLPGVDVARTGGPGSSTSIFIRGSNPNHALVLIDGVRVASATTGAYAFEQLPLELIDRIELVRGPRAAIYGSDAIGGVVQFFTRRDGATRASLTFADDGEAAGAASLGAGDAANGFALALERRNVDGFNVTTPDNFSFDPDEDGFRRSSLALQGRMTAGDRWSLSGLVYGSDGDIEFDVGRSTVEQRQAQLSAEFNASERYSQRLAIAAARDDLTTPAFFAVFNTDRETFDWLHRFDANAAQRWQLGLSLNRERGVNADLSGNPEFDRRRWQRGVFSQWQGEFGAHLVEAAARYDRISNFGGESSGQLAWGWQAGERWRTLVSVGEGFRAPHFNELYSPGFGGFFAGNPALAPERSRLIEVGANGDLATWRWRARAFRNRIDDLIAFSGVRNQAINIREARIDGLELDASGGELWRWSVNATWQNPIDLTRNAQLLRRAKRKFNVSIDRPISSAFSVGGSVGYSSARLDFDGPQDAFATLDLRAAYSINPHWSLEAGLSNAGDEDYQLVSGYTTPGRQWRLALRYRE